MKLSHSLKKSKVKRSPGSRGHHHPGPFKKLPPWDPHWQMPPGANSLPPDLQDCGRNITPVCLKALYDIPNAHIKDNVNMLGLFESGDIYSQQDLNSFFAEYAPYVPQGTHPLLDSIDGGEAPVPPGSEFNTGESDIDMDIGFSLIYVSLIRLKLTEKSVLTQPSQSHKLSHCIKLTTTLKHLQMAVSTHSLMRLMVPIAPTQPMGSQAILQESILRTRIPHQEATKGLFNAEHTSPLG